MYASSFRSQYWQDGKGEHPSMIAMPAIGWFDTEWSPADLE